MGSASRERSPQGWLCRRVQGIQGGAASSVRCDFPESSLVWYWARVAPFALCDRSGVLYQRARCPQRYPPDGIDPSLGVEVPGDAHFSPMTRYCGWGWPAWSAVDNRSGSVKMGVSRSVRPTMSYGGGLRPASPPHCT